MPDYDPWANPYPSPSMIPGADPNGGWGASAAGASPGASSWGGATNALAGAGGALGAWISSIFNKDKLDRARGSMQQVADIYGNMRAPGAADLSQQEGVSSLGPSAYRNIRANPGYADQEQATLAKLRGVSDAGGLDPQARAKLAQASAVGNRNLAGQKGAIEQEMAARGGGQTQGGQRYALQEQAASDAANNLNLAGTSAAGDAENRALQANSQAGNMAAGLEQADFGRQATVAGANDAVSKFNAANLQNVFERNTDRKNRAAQQAYEDEFQRAGGQAGALNNLSGYDYRDYNNALQTGQGIGQGVGAGAGALLHLLGLV